MQYLSDVPYTGLALRLILIFPEDVLGCFGCAYVQETLQLLPEGFVYPMVYSSIRLPTLAMNSRTGSKSGCISSGVVT